MEQHHYAQAPAYQTSSSYGPGPGPGVSFANQASSSKQGSGDDDGNEDDDEPKKKRPRASAPRRALSCTPCRKRKTRCTSGVVPCEACVRRNKPQDCVWETAGEGEPTQIVQYALASDLEALQHQVASLQALISRSSPTITAGAPAPSGIAPSTSAHFPVRHNSSPFLPPAASNRSSNHNSPSNTSSHDERQSGIDSTIAALERRAHSVSTHAASEPSRLRSTSEKISPVAAILPGTSTPSMHLPKLLDRNTRHSALLSEVFAILPSDYAAARLVQAFLGGKMHGGWHVLHEGMFRDEFKEWEAREPARRPSETDPAWLGVYLMVLGLGVQSIPTLELSLLFPSYSDEILSQLPSAFYRAAILSLEVAEFRARPQVRHIQAVLLAFPFLYHFGLGPEDASSASSHLSAAISTAQWLNLDILTEGEELPSAVKADKAFAGKSNDLVREIAKRLFGFLNFLDGTTSDPGLWRLSHSAIRPLTTPLPRNLNDSDLVQSPLPPSRPATELTHSTFAICGQLFGAQVRIHMEKAHGLESGADWTDAGVMDPETTQHYDLALRRVLLELPNPHLGSQKEPNWLLVTMFSSIHNRILRIHRPCLTLGYSDPLYGPSRDACIDSARMVVQTQRLLNGAPQFRPNFLKRWILGAALVLTIDLVVSIDCRLSAPMLASKRAELQVALDIFRVVDPADRTPRVTLQCRKTIEALIVACDARQKDQQHMPPSSPGAGLGDFFAEVYAKLAVADLGSEAFKAPVRQSSIDLNYAPTTNVPGAWNPSAQIDPLAVPVLNTVQHLPTTQEFSNDFLGFDFSKLDSFDFNSFNSFPTPSAPGAGVGTYQNWWNAA